MHILIKTIFYVKKNSYSHKLIEHMQIDNEIVLMKSETFLEVKKNI